jgi:hypothetical protein
VHKEMPKQLPRHFRSRAAKEIRRQGTKRSAHRSVFVQGCRLLATLC